MQFLVLVYRTNLVLYLLNFLDRTFFSLLDMQTWMFLDSLNSFCKPLLIFILITYKIGSLVVINTINFSSYFLTLVLRYIVSSMSHVAIVLF